MVVVGRFFILVPIVVGQGGTGIKPLLPLSRSNYKSALKAKGKTRS